MRVAIFGLGYVGTVTAAGLASRGHLVVGVDVDPLKVQTVQQGRSPVVEPGIEALLAGAVTGSVLSTALWTVPGGTPSASVTWSM